MSDHAPAASAEQLKRRAAELAAARIDDGMVVGLGTGSTVRHLVDFVAEERLRGRWRSIVAVPTSTATEAQARELGIPLTTLDEHPEVDLTIDGADEVDGQLDLVKGLGGALLREKIVAACSRSLVIIIDESKLVGRLGTRAPLPVEVDPFGARAQLPFLRSLGAEPAFRCDAAGAPLHTDGGHLIIDCRFADGIRDARALDDALRRRPGIVETGLFLGMAEAVVVAGAGEVRTIGRGSPALVAGGARM